MAPVRVTLAASLALLLCGLASTGRAQEPATVPEPDPAQPIGPRLAQWVERRQAKYARLEAYRAGFLERQFLAFEKAERPAITELNLFGLYPRVQTIDHRSQWAFGARFWQPDLGGSPVDAAGAAFWSLQGFRYLEAQLGVVPHRPGGFPLFTTKSDDVFELPNMRRDSEQRYELYAAVGSRYSPKLDFFGIGPDSRVEDRSDFLTEDLLYEVVAGYRLVGSISLIARAGGYEVRLDEGRDDELPPISSVFPPGSVPGLVPDTDFVRLGGAVVLDTRDFERNPHSGGVLSAAWTRYDQRGGDAYSFDRYAIDARAYLTLGHSQRVLALRGYLSHDEACEGAQVPFELMAYLGGSHTMRGFLSQRFRGERLALAQAEYRWEASPAIELALFVDYGTVAATSGDPLADFKLDGGIGLRLKTHESLMTRLDLAWSEEAFRILLRFSPSF